MFLHAHAGSGQQLSADVVGWEGGGWRRIF